MIDQPLPAYQGDEPYVFVSYSHEDKNLVYPEIRWLQDQGVNVWWDEGISPGAVWRGELTQALRGSSLILYLITPNAVNSEQCTREINFGLDEYHRPVLAVHLVETSLPDILGLVLSDRQAILKHGLESEDYQRKLVTAIATYLEQPLPEVTIRRTSRMSTWHHSRLWIVACSLLIGGGVVGLATWLTIQTQPPPLRPLARFPIELPSGVTPRSFALSKNGQRIIINGRGADGVDRLYLRALDQLHTTPIEGVEGSIGSVYLSSDSEWVAYDDYIVNALKKVRVGGGLPITVVETKDEYFGVQGLSWAADGSIIYATSSNRGLLRLDASGGPPESLTDPPEGEFHSFPHLLGDGSAVLFTVKRSKSAQPNQIEVLSLVSGERRFITEGSAPMLTSTGHLLYVKERAIWAIPFDTDELRVRGMALPVLEGAALRNPDDSFFSVTTGLNFSASDDGSMLYLPSSSLPERVLVWAGLDGQTTELNLPPVDPTGQHRVSPDGRRIVVSQITGFWIHTLGTNRFTKLTTASQRSSIAIWSSDSGDLFYSSERDGVQNLFRRSADGTGEEQRVTTSSRTQMPSSLSRDGNTLLYVECDSALINCDLGQLSLSSESSGELFLATEADEWWPVLSPDERWVAYVSDVSGDYEVYVRTYPDIENTRLQISTDGAFWPRWSPDGRTLYYIESPATGAGQMSRVMSVAFESQGKGNASNPRAVLDLGPYGGFNGYDLHPDGKRFLLAQNRNPGSQHLVLVQNWLQELERLIPTK